MRLGRTRHLVGSRITEADWRLFTTLVRFDAVYYGHFKCNLRRIVDYPNMWNYVRELYQVTGVAETVDLAHSSATTTRVTPRSIPLASCPRDR